MSSSKRGIFAATLLLGGILLVPMVAAVLTPFTEDFTGDTTPTSDWYSYAGSGTGTRAIQTLNTGYMVGNVFVVGTTANGQTASTTFTFGGNENTGVYEFDLYCNRPVAGSDNRLTLRNENNAAMFELLIDGSGTGNCAVSLIDGSALADAVPATANGWTAHLKFTVNYAADTYAVERTLFGGSPVTLSGRALTTASSAAKSFTFNAGDASSGAVTNRAAIDNLDFGEQDLAVPAVPAGVNAQVIQANNGVDSEVELRWRVSSDDPDQAQGDYGYRMYANGILLGTYDPTTSQDADGIRFNLVIISETQGNPVSFWVRAANLTTGITSGQSCAVTVDTSNLDVDTCGSISAGSTVGLDFTTPTDTAAGLKGWCEDLMGDSTGSVFLCGLMLVMTVFMGVAGALAVFVGKGLPSLVGGSVAGLGMAVFNVVATVWSIVWGIVLIVIAAAIILAASKALTLLGAMRQEGGDS